MAGIVTNPAIVCEFAAVDRLMQHRLSHRDSNTMRHDSRFHSRRTGAEALRHAQSPSHHTVSTTGREFTCAPFFGEKAADAHEKVVEGTKGLVWKGRKRARDRFSVETANLGSMTADNIEGIFHI